MRFDGEVFVLCEQGQVTFEVGGHDHVLAQGDVIHFKATHPFTYRNDSTQPTRFLLAATLPAELRSVMSAHASSTSASS